MCWEVASDMVGGVREYSVLGLAALGAQGDYKDSGLASPLLLTGLGLEKHAGTGTGCLAGQSSFLSELCLHQSQ